MWEGLKVERIVTIIIFVFKLENSCIRVLCNNFCAQSESVEPIFGSTKVLGRGDDVDGVGECVIKIT
jgi:hypothetical protein